MVENTTTLSEQDVQPVEITTGQKSSTSVFTGDSFGVLSYRAGARTAASAWQRDVVSSLCKYLDLPLGWDSYGGEPLRLDTGMFTLQILNSLMGPAVPAPQTVPVGAGGIQVEWHQNNYDVELYIAAPYQCELCIHDYVTGETKSLALSSDYTALNESIGQLMDHSRRQRVSMHGG